MNAARALWASIENDPVVMRRIHGWLTIFWLVASVPIILFLRDSVPALVFISVYANVVGHWSSFQAARVEVRQEEIAADEDGGA